MRKRARLFGAKIHETAIRMRRAFLFGFAALCMRAFAAVSAPTAGGYVELFVPSAGLTAIPCPAVPWWALAIAAGQLLLLLVPLFRRRVLTVHFETGIDERDYFQRYDRGDKVVEPEGFERDGYALAGWYRDRECGERKRWDFGKKLRRSMTLYAKWEEKSGPAALRPGKETEAGFQR